MPDPTKAQLKEQIAELKEQLAAQAEDPAKAVTPTPEAVTPTPAHHSPFTIHDLTVPLDVYLQPEGAAPSRRNWTLSLNPGRRHKLYSLAMALQAQKVGVRKHRHQDKVMVEKVDQAILWLIDAVQIRPSEETMRKGALAQREREAEQVRIQLDQEVDYLFKRSGIQVKDLCSAGLQTCVPKGEDPGYVLQKVTPDDEDTEPFVCYAGAPEEGEEEIEWKKSAREVIHPFVNRQDALAAVW